MRLIHLFGMNEPTSADVEPHFTRAAREFVSPICQTHGSVAKVPRIQIVA
jgi:hypothetical protein